MTANIKSSGWNDDTKAVLRRMWVEGEPVAQIMMALDSGTFHPTKHAVIGCAHRMELGEHPYKAEHRQHKVISVQVQNERRRLADEAKAHRVVVNADRRQRMDEARGLLRAARDAERQAARIAALEDSHPVMLPTRTFATLQDHECRWPLGEVRQPGFGYCGAAVAHGSYCAYHAAVSVRRDQPRDVYIPRMRERQ